MRPGLTTQVISEFPQPGSAAISPQVGFGDRTAAGRRLQLLVLPVGNCRICSLRVPLLDVTIEEDSIRICTMKVGSLAVPLISALLPTISILGLPDAAAADSPTIDVDLATLQGTLTWRTEPGRKYEIEDSNTLASFAAIPGSPIQAGNLAEQYAFTADTPARFFRVTPVDEQVPDILDQFPRDDAKSVGRFRAGNPWHWGVHPPLGQQRVTFITKS